MSADNVRATDAELGEVLRHAAVLASETNTPEARALRVFAEGDLYNLGLSLLPSVARELMALREQHRAADEALTRCGIEATSPRDTLADRLLRVVKDSNDMAEKDAERLAALREKARAVEIALTEYGTRTGFASRAYDATGLCAARAALRAEVERP